MTNRQCIWVLLGAIFLFSIQSSALADTLNIGIISDLTGSSRDEQQSVRQAIELAVSDIKDQGDPGDISLNLIYFDNGGSVIGSRRAARNAIDSNVSGVIGPMRSSNALAAASLLQEAEIVMITPTATHPLITKDKDYIFRTCFTDFFQGKILARFAIRELSSMRAVVLTNTKDKYSKGLAASFIDHFVHQGGTIQAEKDYLEDVTDFSHLVTGLKQHDFDLVFIPGYSKDSGLIIKEIRQQGMSCRILGGDGWGTRPIHEFSGNAINGSFRSAFWHPDLPGQDSRRFAAAFETVYGRITRVDIAAAYEAVMLLVHGVNHAATLEGKDIKAALHADRTFTGVTGKIRLDENGDPLKQVVILKYTGNTAHFHKVILP